MKNLPDHIVPVHLDSTGEVSKTRWFGTFRVKCVLSHADYFAKLRLYAEFMPSKKHLVEEDDQLKAEVLSELSVRIVDGPPWWEATIRGQLMTDFNPLIDLLNLCKESAENWSKKLEEAASFGDGNVVTQESSKS